MIQLVLKLLFKASLPLAMLIGIASYGLYLKGGDPGALFSRVAGGALDTLQTSVRGAASTAGQGVDSLAASARGTQANRAGSQAFYTWVDAAGVRHYSSVDPQRGDANRIEVHPDTNLIAAVPVPAADTDERSDRAAQTRAEPERTAAPTAVSLSDGASHDQLLELLR